MQAVIQRLGSVTTTKDFRETSKCRKGVGLKRKGFEEIGNRYEEGGPE